MTFGLESSVSLPCTLISISDSISLGEVPQVAQHSCLNAWNKIVPSTKPLIFGGHSLHSRAVTVPLRYLSEDGLCAFDVVLVNGAMGDVANGLAVSHAARSLFDVCAIARSIRYENGSGGSVTGFCTSSVKTHTYIIKIKSA